MLHIVIIKENLLYQAVALFFKKIVQLKGEWYSYRFSCLWKMILIEAGSMKKLGYYSSLWIKSYLDFTNWVGLV